MDKSGANAYIFAKASGNIGKSFIGDRAQSLFEQKNLSELWTLLFKTPVPLVPEVLLAEKIEKEAFSKFFNEYLDFVRLYDKPSRFLTDLLCVYEAENLKIMGAALCTGETEMPELTDLGEFAQCNYKAWPDLAAVTGNSQFAWFNKVPSLHELKDVEFKLDLQVVQHLWESINKESGENKQALLKLFNAEYVIKNIVWALRLRLYYKMEKDAVIKKLIYVTDAPSAEDPVAAPALKVLDLPLDEPEAWSKWAFKDLLNPPVAGEVWNVDPGWIEKNGKTRLNRIALEIFHQYSNSDCFLLGWYKIKEFELSCIRTAVESLRLNINSEEAMADVGITDGRRNG